MRKYLAAALVLLLFAMALPGCSMDASSGSGSVGNFRILVSDEENEMFNFSSVNVTISRIGVLAKGSDNFTEIDINPAVSVNLTGLPGDYASELWEGLITTGNYTKVFIYVENATGTLKSGDNVTVKLPGGKLQISKPFTIGEDGLVNFVFDVTVVKAGNSGKYILKPQIDESGPAQPFVDVTPEAQQHGKGSSGDNGEKPEGVPVGPEGDQPNKGKPEEAPGRGSSNRS